MWIQVKVRHLTSAGAKVEIEGDPKPFWLPRNNGKGLMWFDGRVLGEWGSVEVPGWLAKKHRQLVGDREYIRAAMNSLAYKVKKSLEGRQREPDEEDEGWANWQAELWADRHNARNEELKKKARKRVRRAG